MTRRAVLHRKQVQHAAVAEGLREMPGVWLLAHTYPSRYCAQNMAHAVRTASKLPAYAPAGTYEAKVEPVGDESGLYVRYVGDVS